MAYQMAAAAVTLVTEPITLQVIHRLHAFSNAIRRTFVQHFIRFQLTVCSRGLSALAEPRVWTTNHHLAKYFNKVHVM